MSEYYKILLSSSQRQLFEVWNWQFTPTEWERARAAQVAMLEGYFNPYIEEWDNQKSKNFEFN
ncbi:hypothetical protein [Legionella sainthelensi]|uniref:Uncharacterized protein n=1 Tax=Legionella sainthelensi TaxID=28087 RepID=A0A2H5FMN2_9GAMM|nr:hypothetical protein CAB17_12625 [Legionella sainthelensi]